METAECAENTVTINGATRSRTLSAHTMASWSGRHDARSCFLIGAAALSADFLRAP